MLYRDCTDPRARATKDKIMDAYVEMLKRKDRNYISVNDICGVARVSRTTFYRHYRNIADIETDIEDIVLSKINMFLKNMDVKDIVHARKEHLDRTNETIKSNVGFYSKLLLVNQNPVFLDKIIYMIKDLFASKLLSITSIPPSQIDLIVTFAFAGRVAVYRKWIMDGFSPSSEIVSETLSNIASFGLDYYLEKTMIRDQ